MSADPPSTDRDARLDAVIADYLADRDAGRPVSPADLLRRHPDLRPDLDRFFAAERAVRTALGGPAGVAPAPGGRFAGYDLGRVVGRGGTGTVYAAHDPVTGEAVAVKVLAHEATDGPARDRFRAEVAAARLLDHRHVVPVLAAGESDGRAYLVLPLLAGGDLAHARPRAAATPAAVAALLAPVADAVHFAHRRGVLHRDLKPSNVLLDAAGVPRLADFGLVRDLTGGGLTRTGEIVGTLGYLAPEQAAGGPATVATDVHGLGAVLYAVLTGGPPYPGASPAAAVARAVRGDPDPPGRVVPGIPPDLDAVCQKCLAREPADRYATAAEVAADLRRFAAGEPVAARPVGAARRAARWVRRHPGRAAGVGLLAAAVLAAAGAVGWGLERDRAAAERERDQRYAGLMAAVKERSADRPPGWTWDNLADLESAAAIGTPVRDPVALRTELARALLAPDWQWVAAAAEGFTAEWPVYTPDGRSLVLGEQLRGDRQGGDAPVRVLRIDLATGAVAREWRLPRPRLWEGVRDRLDGVSALAVSPDGRWAVAGLRSGRVFALDLADPAAPARSLGHLPDRVRGVAFSSDGRAVSAGSDLGAVVTQWAVGTWAMEGRREFPGQHVRGLTALPDGNLLVNLGGRADGKLSSVRVDGRLEPVGRVAASWSAAAADPTGSGLVGIRGNPLGLEVIDLDRMAEAARLPLPPRFAIDNGPADPDAVAFDPAGRLVAIGTDGVASRVGLWDAGTLDQVGQVRLAGGAGKVAFRPDGRQLAVTAGGRTELFELADRGAGGSVGWSPGPVRAFGFRADGRGLVTVSQLPGSSSLTVAGWPLGPGDPPPARLQLPGEFRPTTVAALAADPGGGHALPLDDGRVLRVRPDGPAVLIARMPRPARVVSFAPPGRLWAAGGQTVRTYTRHGRWEWVNRPPADRSKEDAVLALAAGDGWAYAGTQDGFAHLLRPGGAGGGRELDRRPVTAVAVAPGGGRAAAGGADGRVWVHAVPELTAAADAPVHQDQVTGLGFVGDDLVVSGGRDGRVVLSRVAGGRLVPELTLAVGRPVEALAVAPDGVTVGVLATADRAVRLVRFDKLDEAFRRVGVGVGVPPPRAVPAVVPPSPPSDADRAGWPVHALCREVFATPYLTDRLEVGPDDRLAHGWGLGVVTPGGPDDHFSVRWSGFLLAPLPGRYEVRVTGDDRAAVRVDGRLVAAHEHAEGGGDRPAEGGVELTDRPHRIEVEHDEGVGHASVQVSWRRAGVRGWLPIPPWAVFHRAADADAAATRRSATLEWERVVDGPDLYPAFAGDREVVVAHGGGGRPDRLTVERLDAATGAARGSVGVPLAGRLLGAAVSADGEAVAVLAWGQAGVRVVRTRDGTDDPEFRGVEPGTGSAAWATDRRALTAHGPGGWGEWAPGRGRVRVLPPPAGGPRTVVPAAGGRDVWLFESSDAERLWDAWAEVVGPGEARRSVRLGFDWAGSAVDRAGRRLLTAPRHGDRATGLAGAGVFDLDAGDLVCWLGGPGDPPVVGVALSADGTRAVTADAAGRVRLWALPSAAGR